MNQELIDAFLSQFVVSSRSRIALSMEAVARGDDAGIATAVREMHSIAGEAGLLGQAATLSLARDCEAKAKQLATDRTDAAAEAVLAVMRAMQHEIEVVADHARTRP